VSIGLRNTIVDLYAYSDSGTNGKPVDTWTKVGSYWGRQMDWRGRNAGVQQAPDEVVTSVIALGDDAPVTHRNVLQVGGPGGPVFKIVYTHKRIMLREIHCFAQDADRSVYPGIP
jgi:hypothetical protein